MFSVSEETLVEKQCGHRVQNIPRKMAMYIAKRDVGFTQMSVCILMEPPVCKYRKHKRYFSPSPAVTEELQGSI